VHDEQRQPEWEDEAFLLTSEEDALAQLLSELRHGDFARILNALSPAAKDELRSIIGLMQAKSSFRPEQDGMNT
jgi:hypothetical protein